MKRKDFYWATRPLFIPSILLGLALPFKCERQKSSMLLHLYDAYSFVAFFTALSLTIVSLPEYVSGLITKQVSRGLPIREYVNTAWWVLVATLGVLGHILLRLRRSGIGKALSDMALMESRLGNAYILRINQSIRSWIVAQAMCIAAIFTIAVGIHIHATFFENKAFNGSLNAAGIYWLITALIVDFQFFNFILILSRNFKVINMKMLRIYREMGCKSRVAVTVRARKFESSHLSERILSVAELSLWNRQIAELLNDIYGIFFLIQVPTNLVQVIFHFYYYVEILMGVAQVENVAYNLMEVLVWAISYLCGISLVVAACHSATEQMQRMHYLVSEMLLRSQELQIQRQLRLFSRQLQHTPLKFNACGFFPLDFSLLITMAAATISQLVVLVQFQQTNLIN